MFSYEEHVNYLIGHICEKRLKHFNENDENYPYCAFVRMTGYMFFSTAYTYHVGRQLEDECENGEIISNADVVKEVSDLWEYIGDEGKDLWNTKANQLRAPNP
jgi:hypothetical protein